MEREKEGVTQREKMTEKERKRGGSERERERE